MAAVDNVLLEMERRGHDFFDDTMRIGRVFDLLNRSRVQEGFERQVVADAPQQIEKRVDDLIDWLVDADFRQWQRITRHLADRRRAFRDRIVGARRRRVAAVPRRAAADGRDRSAARPRRSSTPTIGGARRASWPTARATPWRRPRRRPAPARSASARLITIAASTAAADITGILLAERDRGARASSSFRRGATAGEGGDAREDRRRPGAAVDRAAARSSAKRSRAAPRACARASRRTRRFVRAEGEKLDEIGERLHQLASDLGRVRTRIDSLAA